MQFRAFKLCPLFFFAAVASTNAVAFEVNGFRSGMGVDSALRLLRERWDQVSEIGSNPDGTRSFLATARDRSTSEAIIFCRGQLNSYQYDVAGGFRAFVRLVQMEQATAGPGAGQALARETSVGEWSSLNFRWSQGAEHKEISYSLVSKAQVYVRYTFGGVCQ